MDGLCRSGRRLMLWSCLNVSVCLGQLRSASSKKIHARCTRLPVDYWLCSGCCSPAPCGAVPNWPRNWRSAGVPSVTTSNASDNSTTRSRRCGDPAVTTGWGSARSCPRCSSTTTRRSLWPSVYARSPELAVVEDTSARALAKLEAVLPHRLKLRVNAVRDAVETGPENTGTNVPDPDVDAGLLMAVAAAIRDHQEIRFHYRRRPAAPSRAVPTRQLAASLVSGGPRRLDRRLVQLPT